MAREYIYVKVDRFAPQYTRTIRMPFSHFTDRSKFNKHLPKDSPERVAFLMSSLEQYGVSRLGIVNYKNYIMEELRSVTLPPDLADTAIGYALKMAEIDKYDRWAAIVSLSVIKIPGDRPDAEEDDVAKLLIDSISHPNFSVLHAATHCMLENGDAFSDNTKAVFHRRVGDLLDSEPFCMWAFHEPLDELRKSIRDNLLSIREKYRIYSDEASSVHPKIDGLYLEMDGWDT